MGILQDILTDQIYNDLYTNIALQCCISIPFCHIDSICIYLYNFTFKSYHDEQASSFQCGDPLFVKYSK